jgi:hypothetical protein
VGHIDAPERLGSRWGRRPFQNGGESACLPKESHLAVLYRPGETLLNQIFGLPRNGMVSYNMIRKGQVRGVGKGDITGQVSFIASLFAVAA